MLIPEPEGPTKPTWQQIFTPPWKHGRGFIFVWMPSFSIRDEAEERIGTYLQRLGRQMKIKPLHHLDTSSLFEFRCDGPVEWRPFKESNNKNQGLSLSEDNNEKRPVSA